jgi:RNA-binding protein YlmH
MEVISVIAAFSSKSAVNFLTQQLVKELTQVLTAIKKQNVSIAYIKFKDLKHSLGNANQGWKWE